MKKRESLIQNQKFEIHMMFCHIELVPQTGLKISQE